MKKTFMKLSAMLLALSMFGFAFADSSKPYQGALNKFLRVALGDYNELYVTCPPEGKQIIKDSLQATALISGTDLSEFSDAADQMITMMGATIGAETETELTKDQLKTVRTFLNYVLENGQDYKGKKIGEIIPITKGYEVGMQIYSFGAAQSNETAKIVVYKAGDEWFVLRGSMEQIEQELTSAGI